MVLGEIGHQAGGLRYLVEGVVELVLLAKHGAEREVQRGVLWIGLQSFAELEFGFVIVLLAGFGGSLEHSRGDWSCGIRGCFDCAESLNQIRSGASGFELVELLLRWRAHQSTLLR